MGYLVTRIHDATALRAFRENPELYRLRHELHLVPVARDAAPDSGTAFHAALKRWFDTYELDEALAALRAAWPEDTLTTQLFGVAPPEKRPFTLFERLMRGYAERWPQEREGFEVVANEAYLEGEFSVTASGRSGEPDPATLTADSAKSKPREADPTPASVTRFAWCGIRDLKVRYADASEYVVDHKSTSGWLNAEFFAALDLDVQMCGYVGLEIVNGRRCDGYLVDAIHVDTRGHKVDPARDFVRHGPVNVPEWKRTRWARDVEYTLRQIEALRAERGIDAPWPMYANFKFGKVDAYKPFYETPAELHALERGNFVHEPWVPRDR